MPIGTSINGSQLHLLMNHWPVLLPVIAIIVLVIGQLTKLRQTRNVGLAILVAAAVMALPTYFSGQPAQNVVQNYPLITVASIQQHRQVAYYSLWAMEIVGVLGAALLWRDWRGQAVTGPSVAALVVLTLAAFLLVAQAAHLGGLIRHEEITQGLFTSSPGLATLLFRR